MLHRLTAALSALLVLQLTLLGSGTPCTVRGTEVAAKTHDMGAMPGMAASAANATPAASPGASERANLPPVRGHSDDGCRMPWAPGLCTAMTTCTMAAMPSATHVTGRDARPMAADLPMTGALGSRPATPPELPPPRA